MYAIRRIVKLAAAAIFTFCCSVTYAQRSVQFEDISFDAAMAKARSTGKLVFVDVRGMNIMPVTKEVESKVFTQDSVADFFNKNCINIRVNMNSAEGKKFAPHLAMLMYPVYVFFDKDTTQIDFVGAGLVVKDHSVLMGKARKALAEAEMRSHNTRSITFAKGSWKEVLAKAKKENKLIFLDAYTTWCRPCMMMAKNVFTLNEVADYYNEHFINVSMDMEKGDGPALVKKYKIRAYPDFLYIDGNGKIVHRNGGYKEAPEFIAVGKQAQQNKK